MRHLSETDFQMSGSGRQSSAAGDALLERIRDVRASRWTPERVSERLIEAFDVLRRTPARIGPKQFGGSWPAISQILEDFDLDQSLLRTDWKVAMEARARGQEYEAAARAHADDQAAETERQANRPTSAETSRAEEALAWCLTYLRDKPMLADAIQLHARCSAFKVSMKDTLVERCVRADGLVEERRAEIMAEEKRDRAIRAELRARTQKADMMAFRRSVDAAAEREKRHKEIVDRALAWANQRLATARDPEHAGNIKANARIRFERNSAHTKAESLKVRRQDVMPGKCLSKSWLDACRREGAAEIARALNKDGVEVR
jgi:hypothetical protein